MIERVICTVLSVTIAMVTLTAMIKVKDKLETAVESIQSTAIERVLEDPDYAASVLDKLITSNGVK